MINHIAGIERYRKMDVKQAVDLAKKYFQEIFGQEGYQGLGLEEVDFDDPTNTWEITIGFFRPMPHQPNNVIGQMLRYASERSYKIVRISDKTGKVISVKNRELQTS